jgi:hypothetical protein
MNKIIVAIAFSMISLVPVRAEVVVYTEKCGIGAKADYNLLCQIDSNTLEEYIGQIKSIVVCTSYNNRGGMNTPTIVHNLVEGTDESQQRKPTDMFDTIKFHGHELDESNNRMMWDGIGSRQLQGATMHGDAQWTTKVDSKTDKSVHTGTYTEIMFQGRRKLGEVRAHCNNLPGADD